MADRMEEKVARGLVRFRLDHNGHTYQPGAKERYANTAWRDWQGEARAALEACHFGELVEALRELGMAVPPCPSDLIAEFPAEAKRLIAARDKARAVLAKVEASDA